VALCEAIGLTRRFGGNAALQQVTLQLEAATIVALIGPNGSGKMTLFNLLAGQLRPSAGTVRWRGREITAWPPHRRCRAGINRTFQVAQPFLDLTLSENVALGLLYGAPAEGARRRRDALERAQEVLGEFGLAAKAASAARILSLGELKRLELAMAVAARPRPRSLLRGGAGPVPGLAGGFGGRDRRRGRSQRQRQVHALFPVLQGKGNWSRGGSPITRLAANCFIRRI
jgi:branched-chain amino acid transport system ATP-binding protein